VIERQILCTEEKMRREDRKGSNNEGSVMKGEEEREMAIG
jgi:hypothetical protein